MTLCLHFYHMMLFTYGSLLKKLSVLQCISLSQSLELILNNALGGLLLELIIKSSMYVFCIAEQKTILLSTIQITYT